MCRFLDMLFFLILFLADIFSSSIVNENTFVPCIAYWDV